MNKKADEQNLILEIAHIAIPVAVGLTMLYFVNDYTSDLSFQAKLYAEDIAITLDLMQSLPANKIIISYNLPENFDFNLDDKFVYVNVKDSEIAPVKYTKKQDTEIKFERKENNLILEKNEKEVKQKSIIIT